MVVPEPTENFLQHYTSSGRDQQLKCVTCAHRRQLEETTRKESLALDPAGSSLPFR
jgi:hypothetical protein